MELWPPFPPTLTFLLVPGKEQPGCAAVPYSSSLAGWQRTTSASGSAVRDPPPPRAAVLWPRQWRAGASARCQTSRLVVTQRRGCRSQWGVGRTAPLVAARLRPARPRCVRRPLRLCIRPQHSARKRQTYCVQCRVNGCQCCLFTGRAVLRRAVTCGAVPWSRMSHDRCSARSAAERRCVIGRRGPAWTAHHVRDRAPIPLCRTRFSLSQFVRASVHTSVGLSACCVSVRLSVRPSVCLCELVNRFERGVAAPSALRRSLTSGAVHRSRLALMGSDRWWGGMEIGPRGRRQ